jgi:hypothetical protein
MSGDYEDADYEANDREDHEGREEDDRPRANQLVRRSFEGIATLMNNAATQALTAKATADINARWMIAMHRPRDLYDTRDQILRLCKKPGFAEKAIYSVPRGGKSIKGLSIRFAEAAMTAMSNMGCEAQTLYDSDEQRVVRVVATDYESNIAWQRDLTIPKTKEVSSLNGQQAIRQRLNSSGKVVYLVAATDDDVTVKEGSAISKASRTAILRMIPAWILAEARAMCEATIQERAAADPDAERLRMFDAFASLDVKPSWISDWLGHPSDQATPAEVVELRHLYVAIRDGEVSLEEAMKARKGGKGAKGERPEVKPGGVASAMAPKQERKSRGAPSPTAGRDPSEDERREIERDEMERARKG